MANGKVRIDVDGHVATLTISRPEKLNALDLDMLKALADAADEVEANANVRAAILTGEGKGFSAGGDIKAWGGMLP
ncbi:enoyl-CoA hydratase/isomerase family protein, partial [Rhizobium ruizarguesonis]